MTEHRVLDRRPSFDEASRNYNIRAVLDRRTPRSYTWGCGTYLDQGSEGACVGFAWSHEAAARPAERMVNDSVAHGLYIQARKVDEWPGEAYEGTSVLAGAKIARSYGWFTEYRWAFSTQDALAAISRTGPAVIGINWYSGMWEPDANGYLHVTGRVEGGHAILVRGVSITKKAILLHNSWGAGWGGTQWGPGTALLSWSDFDRLLGEYGECCIPVGRKRGR